MAGHYIALAAFLLGLVALVVLLFALWVRGSAWIIAHSPRADRLTGWWHEQRRAGQRWNPEAWAAACSASRHNSRARRGLED